MRPIDWHPLISSEPLPGRDRIFRPARISGRFGNFSHRLRARVAMNAKINGDGGITESRKLIDLEFGSCMQYDSCHCHCRHQHCSHFSFRDRSILSHRCRHRHHISDYRHLFSQLWQKKVFTMVLKQPMHPHPHPHPHPHHPKNTGFAW